MYGRGILSRDLRIDYLLTIVVGQSPWTAPAALVRLRQVSRAIDESSDIKLTAFRYHRA